MENFSSQVVLNQVRAQYNSAPYPAISFWARCPQSALAHATFEAGSSLTTKQLASHRDKKIALLGCGTFEPYAFGKWQPLAQISALDLSQKSLEIAKARCWIRNIKNVKFYCEDLVDFGEQNRQTFDYVHAYGVIHHLQNPLDGFRAVQKLLKPEGFARIMVYSKTSRRRPELLRRATQILGLREQKDWKGTKKLLACFPEDHPLRLTFQLNRDNGNPHGIVDSTLNACEHAFSLHELLKQLDDAGLSLQAWDFSATIQNFLRPLSTQNFPDINENAKLLNLIRHLEAFDQWPAPFTFWVTPKKQVKAQHLKRDTLVTAQLKAPPFWQKQIYSTLLKTRISLSPNHLEIWRQCFHSPQIRTKFTRQDDVRQAFEDLLSARFLLEVRQNE